MDGTSDELIKLALAISKPHALSVMETHISKPHALSVMYLMSSLNS